jgi:hypothetical protein
MSRVLLFIAALLSSAAVCSAVEREFDAFAYQREFQRQACPDYTTYSSYAQYVRSPFWAKVYARMQLTSRQSSVQQRPARSTLPTSR